ncbi:hypothetical protein P3S68_025763 [Capsicum galapagoense]
MIAVEDFSFEKLMLENNSGRVCKMGSGGVIRELKDIPTELLRIASLVDDRTVIVASGVCRLKRCFFLGTHLSFPFLVLLLVITVTECTLHVNLGWCDKVGDEGVMRLAYGCPDLRALDLCGCLLITVFGKEIPNVEASDSTVSVNSPR